MELIEKVKIVIERLSKLYPNPKLELDFENPFQLLVMAIMAAQDSDKKVNKVAKRLFAVLSDPVSMALAGADGVGEYMKEIRWGKQKAKNIAACCEKLVSDYDGKVPDDVEELTKLPGVGRKTANMVVGGAFKKPAIIADRHFIRVANRLGLTKETKPEKVEKELTSKLPPEYWLPLSLLLIEHGKKICKAQNPLCKKCPLTDVCDCYLKTRCEEYRKPTNRKKAESNNR